MRRNLRVTRGQTRTFTGVLRDDAGDPIDLTSATLTWKMGDNCFTRVAVSLSEGDGITVTDATAGAWSITIRPTDTSNEQPGSYVHQGEAVIGSATYGFTSGRVELGPDL